MAIHQKVIEYSADITRVINKLKAIEAANSKLQKNLNKGLTDSLTPKGTILDKSGQPIAKVFDNKGQAKTVKLLNETSGALQKVNKDSAEATQQINKYNQATKNAADTGKQQNQVTKGTIGNLRDLANRAALVIPVWLALRSAFTGALNVLKNGVRDIASADAAFQKLARNIKATSKNLDSDLNTIQASIEGLSLESGKSVEEITNAVQKFATVGFGTEASLTGGIEATKLAVLLFGDATDTADAFARSLRTLTEGMDDNEAVVKTIRGALALTDELWQTNAFEVDEFSDNLRKFAAAAKAANLSVDETLKLLATLSTAGLGKRAGRLLRSTILKSLADIEKINATLQLGFDPNKQSTLEFILLLVERLKDLKSVEGVPAELAAVLEDLFSIRRTEAVAALVALEKTLKDNLALSGDLKEFNNNYDEQTKKINRLTERYTNYNKEIGKAFVTGLTGSKDFEKALIKIIQFQEAVQRGARDYGEALRNLPESAFGGFVIPPILDAINEKNEEAINKFSELRIAILDAFAGDLDQAQLSKLFGDLLSIQTKGIDIGLERKDIDEAVVEVRKQLIGLNKEENKTQIIISDQAKAYANQLKSQRKTREGALKEEKLFRKELEASGINQLAIEKEILALKIRSNFATNTEIRDQENLIATLEKIQGIELGRARVRGQIESQLQILRLQGASESALIQTRNTLEEIFNIDQGKLSLLNKELELRRAVTNEIFDQQQLSSEALKLFKISEKFGTGTAKGALSFLRGEDLTTANIRFGGDVREAVQEFFPAIKEAREAFEFFTDGLGRTLDIARPELFNPNLVGPRQELVAPIQLPSISNRIDNIKVEVKKTLTDQDFANRLIDSLVDALRNDSRIRQSVESIIENY